MTDTAPDLDTLLQQLADKLGSTPSSQPGSAPESPTTPGEPDAEAKKAADEALAFRKMFAEEMKYWEMIPPLDSDTRRQIDLIMQQLPDMLKSLRDQPYLSSETDRSIAMALTGTGPDERMLPLVLTGPSGPLIAELVRQIIESSPESGTTESERGHGLAANDQELVAVIEQMQTDMLGEERAVPAILVVAVVGLGGTATGVAIGAAARKAWNNLFD